MLHRSNAHPSSVPGRQLRILIEDPDLAALPMNRQTVPGADVHVCSGPRTDLDACPLVTDGACPLGDFDAVVSTVDGAWRTPIRRAWAQTNTVLAKAEPDPSLSPDDQYDGYIGAALRAMFRARYLTRGAEGDRLR